MRTIYVSNAASLRGCRNPADERAYSYLWTRLTTACSGARTHSLSFIRNRAARPLMPGVRCLRVMEKRLSKTSSDKQLWIGGARVMQPKRNGALGDADGAYVNVIALAAGKSDFRSQIKKALGELNLTLVRLADAELLAERLKKHTIHKDLHALAKEVRRTGSIRFDVFHTFDDNT